MPDADAAAARRAIVLADGAAPSRTLLDAAWPGWSDGTALVVAADGGVRHATLLGLTVQRWVGDGDSVRPEDLEDLEAAGVGVVRVAVAKDESDTELALLEALAAGAGEVVVLGALGGIRVDHALANLGLLLHPALDGRGLTMYDEHGARITLLAADGGPATQELRGRDGDLVSLLPIGRTAEGVTTDGLRYPLASEPLTLGRTRGVSNVRVGPVASVRLEAGRLLVIETPANLAR